jgi:hypothetical protein
MPCVEHVFVWFMQHKLDIDGSAANSNALELATARPLDSATEGEVAQKAERGVVIGGNLLAADVVGSRLSNVHFNFTRYFAIVGDDLEAFDKAVAGEAKPKLMRSRKPSRRVPSSVDSRSCAANLVGAEK